jgi:tol-pal system protein YbgF
MKKLIFLLSALILSFSTCYIYAEDAPVVEATPSDNSLQQVPDQAQAQPQSSNQSAVQDNSNLSIDQRVAILERQMSAANQVGLMNQVNDLQSQLQELQGQVEQLSHSLQTLQSQSTSQYSDLDQRLAKLGSTGSGAAVVSTSSSQNTPDALTKNTASKSSSNMEEQQSYDAAYDKVKSGNYSEAIVNLKKFLGRYPSGVYAPNAHYWLGQMYLLKGDGRNAAKEFDGLIKQYPQTPKIKDAKLKLGFAYLLQNKNAQAKAQFKKVIAEYPDSSTAKLARARLAEMA